MEFSLQNFRWTREPAAFTLADDRVEVITKPHTDLWQRTYYHFRNDNAPVFQMETEEKFFSFTVRTAFESKHRFDQCGVVMYLDSDNWLKGSIEYENEQFQHLGSVVTNLGYSDWATTEIDASVKEMWYRLSRRQDDYCLECSYDGITFHRVINDFMIQGGYAICGKAAALSASGSMPAAPRIPASGRYSPTCAWRSASGQPMTASSLTKPESCLRSAGCLPCFFMVC